MAEKNFIVRNGLTVSGGVTIDSDISIGGSLTVGGAAVTPGLDSAEIKTLISGGTGITYTEATGVIATDDTAIVHDNLSGFSADEHVAHSTINITAGDGLTGGGTIDSNVTINVVGGTGITVSADAVEITASGVAAATYGDSSTIPVITVNDRGQVTAVVGASVNIPEGYNDANVDSHLSGGTGITYTSGVIATNDAQIVHDNLSGFVANEHINHSGVTITAGDGLTGGGDITTSRTITVGQGTGISVGSAAISTNDAEIVHDNLSGYVANEHVDHSGVSITAGTGLSGGGDITATRTINIANTGVVAGSYGSASEVPVFNVNAQGQIDSATTVSVAGVSSTAYDSSTGVFTINTADGGSFNTTLHDSADLESRARYAISVTGDLSYSAATGVISYADTRDLFDSGDFDTAFAAKTTDDLTEGSTNLYYDSATTVTVARNSVSATDAGGDGSFAYNAGTGVFTYTGPSASEVRAHFSAGTGVTLSSGEISIGQAVGITDSVVFAGLQTTGNLVVGGNLQVDGTTTTVNTENLSVSDNMIYLNDGESSGSPTLTIDVGWAANVNDPGSYQHVGMFRDATDDTFKVFEGYTPEPDSALEINTGHASFSLAPFAARTLEGKYLGADSDIDARLSGGTGITYSSGAISTNDAEIVHDNLSGFVANEHINHSSVSITAGTGLSGGGDITTTRTINIANTGVAAATYGDSSTIPQITVNAQGQITAVTGASVNIPAGYGDSDVEAYLSGGTGISFASGVISTNDGQIVHDNLSGFVANEHIDHSSVSISAGNGLTGGGDITTTRTLNVGAGTGISVAADAISTNDAEIVHDNLSGFVSNEHIDHSTVSITAGAGLTGGGTIASTRTINVGAGTGITVNADDIAISNTGVSAATYGDSSTIPVITVNAQGQITAVVGAGVNIPAGYGDADVEAYLSGGTGITFSSGVITNAGVTSVNSVTGAVTATNLLDAIKTVDGASSGLDADLLDGQEGSYYRIDVYNAAGTLLN